MIAIQFATPGLLLLALLVPLAGWLRLRRGRPAATFAPAAFLEGLPATWRTRIRHLPAVLFVAGVILAVVALARPVELVAVPDEREGIDILLCLDTSSSMATNDLDPRRTRLDVAKEAAARFVAGRPDDRIGLVAFARYPDLRCPPTLDHDALLRMLAGVERVEADGPEDATAIGTAVARAAQALGDRGAASRVVILLTDGEENVATADRADEIAPVHAAQLCADEGIRVYTIAAGLGRRTASGEWVALDTSQVRDLARRTGGRFFTARDADAVAGVYRAIDEMETARLPDPELVERDRFGPFLLAALALLLAGRLLAAGPLAVRP